MPYIQARLSINMSDAQKDDLQSKLTAIAEEGLSKPKTYIMAEIEDNCALYMAGQKPEKAAYISVKLLGNPTKDRCNFVTQRMCKVLTDEYGIDGSKIYISFHPVDLWGWNGMMF